MPRRSVRQRPRPHSPCALECSRQRSATGVTDGPCRMRWRAGNWLKLRVCRLPWCLAPWAKNEPFHGRLKPFGIGWRYPLPFRWRLLQCQQCILCHSCGSSIDSDSGSADYPARRFSNPEGVEVEFPEDWNGWRFAGRFLVSPDGERMTARRLDGLLWRDGQELRLSGYASRLQAERGHKRAAVGGWSAAAAKATVIRLLVRL